MKNKLYSKAYWNQQFMIKQMPSKRLAEILSQAMETYHENCGREEPMEASAYDSLTRELARRHASITAIGGPCSECGNIKTLPQTRPFVCLECFDKDPWKYIPF